MKEGVHLDRWSAKNVSGPFSPVSDQMADVPTMVIAMWEDWRIYDWVACAKKIKTCCLYMALEGQSPLFFSVSLSLYVVHMYMYMYMCVCACMCMYPLHHASVSDEHCTSTAL